MNIDGSSLHSLVGVLDIDSSFLYYQFTVCMHTVIRYGNLEVSGRNGHISIGIKAILSCSNAKASIIDVQIVLAVNAVLCSLDSIVSAFNR